MPNINLDDAYILGETGAQVDKVTGLYFKDESTSAAEKAFAQLNIGTAGSNRNLLDNPWWGSGEVVNQRGVSTFTTGAYNIDRWYFYKSATASAAALSADGVAFTYASGDMQLTQSIPASVYDYIAGKTVTLSILLSDGTIVSGTGTASASSLVTLIPRSTNFMGMIQGSNRTVYIRAYQNATIRAVKLELGSVSTLANDAPPDYGEELAKCMRYFQRLSGYLAYIGSGYCDDTSNAYFICPLSVPLRSGATVSLSYSGVYLNSNSIQAVTGLTVLRNPTSYTTGSIALKATASGLTAKAPALLQIRAENGYIDLSADL